MRHASFPVDDRPKLIPNIPTDQTPSHLRLRPNFAQIQFRLPHYAALVSLNPPHLPPLIPPR